MSFLARRFAPRPLLRASRSLHTEARASPRRKLVISGAVLGTVLVGAAWTQSVEDKPTKEASVSSLFRTWLVYWMCDIPILVDNAPSILNALLAESTPGFIRGPTSWFVRHSFFSQFVGGDTAADCVPLLQHLRENGQGALFAYSVEIDESGEASGKAPVHKRIVDEMIRCIDVAADFEETQSGGRKTWVAIKLSALLPTGLHALSKHITKMRPQDGSIPFPGCPHPSDLDALSESKTNSLNEAELTALRELHADMIRICTRAQQRGVRIILDAEYSWYQPALDALTLDLMRRFNKLPGKQSGSWFKGIKHAGLETASSFQPLIYGTFQAYLQRTPGHIAQSLKDAKAGGYALGVKLVRGAYHPYEIAAHAAARGTLSLELKEDAAVSGHDMSLSISPDDQPPVWLTKRDTDKCYNDCAQLLLQAVAEDIDNSIPTIGVLFGTHNWISCNKIIHSLVEYNLASIAPPPPRSPKEETVVSVMAEVRESLSINNIPPTGISEVMPDGTNYKKTGVMVPTATSGGKKGAVMPLDVLELPVAVTERIAIAQLYGMGDDLTGYLAKRTTSQDPFVLKYLPYGALSEVMPYLSRRAIENKSVLSEGGAQAERDRASGEIWRRVFRA